MVKKYFINSAIYRFFRIVCTILPWKLLFYSDHICLHMNPVPYGTSWIWTINTFILVKGWMLYLGIDSNHGYLLFFNFLFVSFFIVFANDWKHWKDYITHLYFHSKPWHSTQTHFKLCSSSCCLQDSYYFSSFFLESA